MVDFQSRDTRRNKSGDDGDDGSGGGDGSSADDESGVDDGNDVHDGGGSDEGSPDVEATAGDEAVTGDGAVTNDGAATDDGAPASDGASPSGAARGAVAAAVVTVSNGRTHEDDPGGEAVASALEDGGHDVVTREVLRPSHDRVQQTVSAMAARDDVDAVVTTGGTGVGPDDVTVEAVHPLVDKGLPGFGELFRRRYADSVGTDVVGTRATAGITEGTPVFCLPGDADAADVGTSEIVVEQAPRLADLANGDGASDG